MTPELSMDPDLTRLELPREKLPGTTYLPGSAP